MNRHNNSAHCSVFIAASLDGYIARQDRSIDWLSIAQSEGEDYGYKAFFDSVDVLVMGRNTYDTVLGFDSWPYNGKRCIVLSHRGCASVHGEEFFAGEPSALVATLQGKRVYVDGGNVISQFLAAGLVDELTLSIIPILLGSGIRLFDTGIGERSLILEECRNWPTGVVRLRYRASVAGSIIRAPDRCNPA